MKLNSVRSNIRRIIREEIDQFNLEESLIDFVFSLATNVATALVDKHRDYLLNNLKDDPEIKAMQRDFGRSREEMAQAFTRRYQSNKAFKSKVNSLIKKIK